MIKISSTILVFLLLLFNALPVFAQTSSSMNDGIAIPTSILGTDIPDGSIICSSPTGYKMCEITYDSSIYGVVTDNPSVSLGLTPSGDRYVTYSGIVTVRVNASNGSIKEGDLITTSDTAGVGQKADKNGYVLGTSLGSFDSADKTQVSTILVSINIFPYSNSGDTRGNLIDLLRTGLSSTFLTPISALRYLLAALVTVSSFILGFIFFGRIAKAGVEGIARNPLAQRRIELTVVFHVLITLSIFLLGVGISYLILVI